MTLRFGPTARVVAAVMLAGTSVAVLSTPAQSQVPELASGMAPILGGAAPAPGDGTPLCGVEQPPAGAPIATADDGVLRVATFNVLHSETDAGDASLGERLPLQADAIAASRADVVGAQELTRNLELDTAGEAPQRHGLVAQRLAAAVAARTGEPWSWCWSLSNPHVPLTPDLDAGGGNPLDHAAARFGNFPDEGDFSEGLAVLSRFPIEQSRFRRLLPRSYEAAGCLDLDPLCALGAVFDSRQVLWARVATPTGGLDVFTTHLAHTLGGLSDTSRLLQAHQAVAITREWALPDPHPDVLLGDFNSRPGSEPIKVVTDARFVDGYLAGGGEECTAPGAAGCSGGPPPGGEVWTDGPERPMAARIDYAFLRPPAGCDLAVPDAARIGDVAAPLEDGRYLWPSDHYGFVVQATCAGAG